MAKKSPIKITITGGKELERRLKLIGTAALTAAGASLYRSAEGIMGRSKEQFVPVDTGTLKNSGTVGLPQTKNNKISVSMGYGGAAKQYAVAVHETPKNYRGGKSWKYLETPWKEGANDMANNLKDDLSKAIETTR